MILNIEIDTEKDMYKPYPIFPLDATHYTVDGYSSIEWGLIVSLYKIEGDKRYSWLGYGWTECEINSNMLEILKPLKKNDDQKWLDQAKAAVEEGFADEKDVKQFLLIDDEL